MRIAGLLAGIAGIVSAAAVEVPPGDPSIRYLGRWSVGGPSGEVRWSWSASGAAVTFSGTGCSVHLQARGAVYDVLVDGRRADSLDLSTDSDTLFELAKGLLPGVHTVGLRSRTEAEHSIARFRGFRVDGIPRPADPAPERRIEFYGNSITCGYGILDSVKEHHFDIRTEDEALTYAALASDSLGAERHTVCWSGRGVVQNYGGDTSNPTIPRIFSLAAAPDTAHWDFSLWTPQVVVVDLGTNDYSTTQPDSGKFHRVFSGFVDSLHAKYPAARFVLLDGPMLSPGSDACNRLRRNLDDVVSDAAKRGIPATHLTLSAQDGSLGYGADWHPSRRQAALNGRELSAFLGTWMGWGPSALVPRVRDSGSPDRAGLIVREEGGRLVTGAMRSGRFVPLDLSGSR